MTAVIYARYSSDNQREESIEGQIRECTAYAERNGITVVRHYIDRALSAKTDNRPDFQQMIRDSNKKLFEIVLVWKFDRFARNRFDSANYKMILKKNNVHLISVMEPIAEGSQGILVETLLEGMAEYYSAELSEKVIRGQTENALKGKCTGGTGTIGYKIDEEKFYRIDPLVAPFVLEAFQRYDNGEKIVEILNYLNEKGVRNMLGGKLTCSSMNTMLKNRRYIGELSFRDTVVPDAIPAIVPKDLFDRVQKRLEKNKRAPARGKADEEYLLTTKLFCGKCGALMFGESGTSATGRTYYYYKCATAKRRKGCNKKTVQKDWLESLVVQETMKLIQDDAMIERIVQLVMDFQNQENTTIPLLEKQLREVDRKLDNLMKAIEEGLFTRTTKERLDALEAQKDELTAKIADEKLRKPSFNADFIRFWLMKFRKFDISQQKQRKALIEIFVNAIFLYDDRMLITFNYKDGSQTIRFEDALTAAEAVGNSSDLSSSARYKKKATIQRRKWRLYRGFICCTNALKTLVCAFLYCFCHLDDIIIPCLVGCGEVGQSDLTKVVGDHVVQALPHRIGAAVGHPFAGGSTGHKAAHGGKAALGQQQDLCHGVLVGGAGQPVAAALAAQTFQKAVLHQHLQDVFQIFFRDLLPFGDLLQRHIPLRLVFGQVDHYAQCVTALG